MPTSLLHISEQQNDQALEVAVGGKIIISLGCNRATGHAWSVQQPLPAELRPDGEATYNAPPPTRPAAWGEEVFTFLAARPGSARLRMAYALADQAPAKGGRTFGVIINVRGDAAVEDDAPVPRTAATKSTKTASTKVSAGRTATGVPAKKAAPKKAPVKKSAGKKTSKS